MADFNIVELRAELSRDEDRVNHPYRDSKGILTVGVGWNLDANGIPPQVKVLLTDPGDPLDPTYIWPEPAIDALLDIGIERAETGLDHLLPDWRDMDPVRQRVCLNMCFNMGEHTLGEFHNTLAAIAAGNWAAAAEGMKESAWAKQVGARATRLIAAMQTGTMPGEVVA
jgi:lysozyme